MELPFLCFDPSRGPPVTLSWGSKGYVGARYGGYELNSAFQPIYSPAHGRAVGFEALLRVQDSDGVAVAPPDLFKAARAESRALELDRASRLLHVRNFVSLGLDQSWLFMNFDPSVLLAGKRSGRLYTNRLLESEGLAPERVVVEILESAIEDEGLLAEAVVHYREMGCLVAIDDFGAGHSNFDRIWRVGPDIVKLDRNISAEAVRNPRSRRILPSLASLLHEAGCLVLMEGVETEEEALIALDADVDFIQGYFLSRPSLAPFDALAELEPGILEHLADDLRERHERESWSQHERLSGYVVRLEACARAGGDPEDAFRDLLDDERVKRCFVLDGMGRQEGPNLLGRGDASLSHGRFEPIAEAEGADWSRRAYFRRAARRLGEPQVSGPYLSLPDADMCVTLSIALDIEGARRVYCCDLSWDEGADVGLLPGVQLN